MRGIMLAAAFLVSACQPRVAYCDVGSSDLIRMDIRFTRVEVEGCESEPTLTRLEGFVLARGVFRTRFEDDEPVPGVSIAQAQTSEPFESVTSTDLEGRFSADSLRVTGAIAFSAIGFAYEYYPVSSLASVYCPGR